jgi:hypothetical protein
MTLRTAVILNKMSLEMLKTDFFFSFKKNSHYLC